jgi:hypothetical protein
LENAIDPAWDANDILVENVAPPEGVSGFAGMPPELEHLSMAYSAMGFC